MAINLESGTAFANQFMKDFAAGFKNNNHDETIGKHLCDNLTWDWSDGTKVHSSQNKKH